MALNRPPTLPFGARAKKLNLGTDSSHYFMEPPKPPHSALGMDIKPARLIMARLVIAHLIIARLVIQTR